MQLAAYTLRSKWYYNTLDFAIAKWHIEVNVVGF